MRRRMRLRLLIAVATLPLALFAALPLVAGGQTGRIASIQKKSSTLRSKIESTKRRERVLSGDIAVWSRRISALQSDITVLQTRQARIQADLDAKRARLSRIQTELRLERARLARLRRKLADSRVVLARRLVDLYKADKPDVITVVLEADGFADLLERSEFAKRVSEQDARIIRTVKKAKADAVATSRRLAKLEVEARRVAAAIEARRDEVARVKGTLVDRRDDYATVRSRKSSVLAGVRSDRHEMEGDLRVLEAEQARISASLQQAASNNGYNPAVSGPPRAGSSLLWPVNGPIVSPFGCAGAACTPASTSPSRRARRSAPPRPGTVAMMGWVGGYGNYTCIAHSGALSTCYAHQSRYGTSQGASGLRVRSSATSAAPATATATTCTSRPASTGRRSTRLVPSGRAVGLRSPCRRPPRLRRSDALTPASARALRCPRARPRRLLGRAARDRRPGPPDQDLRAHVRAGVRGLRARGRAATARARAAAGLRVRDDLRRAAGRHRRIAAVVGHRPVRPRHR